MPLGADNGAPDADVFEVTVPETSVLTSNILVANFASAISSWNCADLGAAGPMATWLKGRQPAQMAFGSCAGAELGSAARMMDFIICISPAFPMFK
jgi:hypothetical protein